MRDSTEPVERIEVFTGPARAAEVEADGEDDDAEHDQGVGAVVEELEQLVVERLRGLLEGGALEGIDEDGFPNAEPYDKEAASHCCAATGPRRAEKSAPLPSPPAISSNLPSISAPRPSMAARAAPTLVALESS